MAKKEVDPYTDDEVEMFYEAAKDLEERLIITFIAESGCRENELLRLEPDWVELGEGRYGTLIVPVKATSGVKPKTKKIKHVPMTRRLQECLVDVIEDKEWRRECRERVKTYRGNPGRYVPPNALIVRTPQHIWNVVRRVAKRAGITKRAYPHLFRHYFITRCYYVGKLADKEIGDLAGHANGDMVKNVYLHIDSEKTRSKLEESGFLE